VDVLVDQPPWYPIGPLLGPPVVVALASERRLAELRALLRVSPRALALTLKSLAQAGLIERRIHDGFPPTTSSRLTPRAQPLRKAAEGL